MSLGIIVNCLSVLSGAFIGSFFIKNTNKSLHDNLPILFGVATIAIAINSIILVNNMTVVVLALLIGFCVGDFFFLEKKVEHFFTISISKLPIKRKSLDMDIYVTVVALFCCSGFGWYAVLTESISGNSSIILTKSVLDFFTSLLFGTVLGSAVCVIPIAQFVILSLVFLVGMFVEPYVTSDMFLDLSACGGVLSLCAGLRVAKIKSLPIINLLPSLILIVPLSALWTLAFG